MTAHLLRLSDLEAAAPGILKVIFGPDGGFKNAPPFAGPVSVIKTLPDMMPGGYLWIHGGLTPDGIWHGAGRLTSFDAVALDCRVPTVAARLVVLLWRAVVDYTDVEMIRLCHFNNRAVYDLSTSDIDFLADSVRKYAKDIAALRGAP